MALQFEVKSHGMLYFCGLAQGLCQEEGPV